MLSFKIGDRVREILHPDAWGTVVEIGDSSTESAKYDVNWDDGTAGVFDAVALKPVSPDEENARAAERAIAEASLPDAAAVVEATSEERRKASE